MKTMITLVVCLLGGMLFAQDSNVEYSKEGDLVKGVFYYENGIIQQEGTYKNGKLHGQWISYDRDGKKSAVAFYNRGEKAGKWFFWNHNQLIEVDYSNNTIAEVKTYRNSESDAYVSEN